MHEIPSPRSLLLDDRSLCLSRCVVCAALSLCMCECVSVYLCVDVYADVSVCECVFVAMDIFHSSRRYMPSIHGSLCCAYLMLFILRFTLFLPLKATALPRTRHLSDTLSSTLHVQNLGLSTNRGRHQGRSYFHDAEADYQAAISASYPRH